MPIEIIVRPTLGSYSARAKGHKGTASRSEGARQAAEALLRKLDLGTGQLQSLSSDDLPTGQQRFHFVSVELNAPADEATPKTLAGLKRHAKKIKKERGIIHAQALELSAQRMGYPCYKAALANLGEPNERDKRAAKTDCYSEKNAP